jgi:RNA polymerase sigma factor (sigma-70 family)
MIKYLQGGVHMGKHYGDLIIRLSENDNEAFEIIYSDTKNLVFSIIYPLVGDLATTEDLMQDTYIKMLKNLESYNLKKPFTPWLAQIAKNIAYDHLRKMKRERKAQTEILKVEHREKSIDIDIDNLIMDLDDEKRNIVVLRIVGNLSFKEISKIEGKPLGTVYSIYKLALKELKIKLRKDVRR